MRVVYVIDGIGRAGAEQSLLALAAPLRDRGVDLHIAYAFERAGQHDRFLAAGATLTSLDGRGGRTARVARARRLIRDVRPDLVHTTLFESDLIGRAAGALTRTPVVSSLVNAMYGPEQLANPELRRSRVRLAQTLDTASARVVRRFHAISHNVADTMAPRLHIRPDRIDVIYRGRDPGTIGTREHTRRRRVRAELGLRDDEAVVLGVARHEYQKGLDVLCRAYLQVRARQPSARLLIAGRHGSSTSELEAVLAGGGVDPATVLLGRRDDVPDLYCAADVFAFPTRWEGLGSTLIEAMALEAPIVVSDLPVTRELIGDTNACYAPVDDATAFAGAILAVLADPEGARVRTKASYARFLACFTSERVADQTLAFYERALRRTGVTRRRAGDERPGADR
ncbi:MAG: glycosyltransferase [Actinomycetia bacterium]|nr:glycosyltransferase [Actinomycetes bacterium]